MIYATIINEDNGLCKVINVTNYGVKDLDKLFRFYDEHKTFNIKMNVAY